MVVKILGNDEGRSFKDGSICADECDTDKKRTL